ncbi:hypothetical protein C1H76_0693 [Elsinoe australis]|uniref:Uncharacterized protein n=1 Tax=Elsinoe australis TaxID=40998 RepID=A0A4U7B7B9_9PEZI|nr:hypothetical protein C1H76_0693 [Elsinoe australis]
MNTNTTASNVAVRIAKQRARLLENRANAVAKSSVEQAHTDIAALAGSSALTRGTTTVGISKSQVSQTTFHARVQKPALPEVTTEIHNHYAAMAHNYQARWAGPLGRPSWHLVLS